MKNVTLILAILIAANYHLSAQYEINDWSVYFGGKSKEYLEEIAIDSANNIIMSGKTETKSGIATTGAYQTIYGGGSADAFLAKFNEQGTLLWATYFGGPGLEFTYGTSVDFAGNIFITGATSSTTGIIFGNAQQPVYGGDPNDAFLAKFDPDGHLIWSTYLGGSGGEQGMTIANDAEGNVCIAGYTGSKTGIVTPGAYQSNYVGQTYDCYLAKFDADGRLLFATYFGGIGDDRPHDLHFDFQGNIIMNGTTPSIGLATPGVHQEIAGGELDAFLSKWTPDGQLIWSTYFGGTFNDRARECFPDEEGNIYMTGFTNSKTNISTPGSYQPNLTSTSSHDVKHDAYLAKFNTNGLLVWATYFGGTAMDWGRGVRISPTGHIIISGATESTVSIASSDGFQTVRRGGSDSYIAEFTSAGGFIGATYYGGTKNEPYDIGYGPSLEIDHHGNVYIGPTSSSSDVPHALNAFHANGTNTTYDAVLTRFSPNNLRSSSLDLSVALSLQANVYPNPANFMTTITFESSVSCTGRLTISDVTGRCWHSETLSMNEGANTVNLDLRSFPTGAYFISVDQDQSRARIKLMVQH